ARLFLAFHAPDQERDDSEHDDPDRDATAHQLVPFFPHDVDTRTATTLALAHSTPFERNVQSTVTRRPCTSRTRARSSTGGPSGVGRMYSTCSSAVTHQRDGS